MMEQALIIFHDNCPDGYTAAWLLDRYLRTVDDSIEPILFPGKYGQAPPTVTGLDVYIVDFCYEPDYLQRIEFEARTLTVLDHHQTGAEWIVKAFGEEDVITRWTPDLALMKGIYVLDQAKSGAGLVLAWTKLHTDEKYRWVRHIEDRDLWRFRFPETKDVFALVTSYAYTLQNYDAIHMMTIPEMVIEGRAINRWRDQLIAQVLEEAREDDLLGHSKVWVAPSPYSVCSDVAGELAKRDPFRFAATYVDKPGGTRKWSLRSTDQGMDVAELAATRPPGGGHTHAAGFEEPR